MSLSQISSAHADGLGRAERCEAVHECDADLNLCILPVEVSRHLRSWCAPPPGPRSKANADCRARRLRRQHGRMPRQNRSSPSMVPSPRHCSAVPGRRQGQTIAPKRQRHIPRRHCLTQMRQRGPGPEGRRLRRLGRRRDDPARQPGQHPGCPALSHQRRSGPAARRNGLSRFHSRGELPAARPALRIGRLSGR